MQLKTETVTNCIGQTLFRVTLKNDREEIVTRILALEDYLKLLESSMRMEKEECFVRIPAGRIPKGYIDGKFSKDGFALVFREKGEKRLFIHRTGHYRIPYPDLIFALEGKKGNIKQKLVFAAKGDALYRYPFGNVSANGHICMGSIPVDLKKGGISGFTEAFFEGVTNEDYFEEGESVRPNWSQAVLLQNAAKKETFPVKWLAPAPYATVGELVRKFLG